MKGEYAEVNGLKMYYEIRGEGQPLVLLHGSFGWALDYPLLSEGRQIIAMEMQGHGHTADIDRPFSYEQMADDVAAVLKQLEINQADVFGYSLGGTIGLALAIRYPQMVRRLAVFGAAYRPKEEAFPPDVLKQFNSLSPETFAPKEFVEAYEKMSPAPDWKNLVTKIIRMEDDYNGFSDEQMKSIEAEVFIAVGDRNDVSLEHTVKMYHLIPKSQLGVFPGTEHIVMMVSPDKVLPSIKEFLDEK